MPYTTKDKIRKKKYSINIVMHNYQNAFDRSIKYRAIADKMREENKKEEFHSAYSKMVDAEISCVQLDEKLSRLVDEYKSLELQLQHDQLA